MQITVRDAARAFGVEEEVIHHWIRDAALPAVEVHGQVLLNRTEVLDWALTRRIPVPDQWSRGPSAPVLAEAIRAGGVFHGLPGDDRDAALQAVVGAMPLPPGEDRSMILRLLLAREATGSTAIAEGIALPHARHPMILRVPRAVVTISFLARPVDFGAPDGKPTHTVFMMITPTVRAHLDLLARLTRALGDGGFMEAVRLRAPAEEIIEAARTFEGG